MEIDINRQVVEAFSGPYQEQPGRVRKLMRLYKQQKKLLNDRIGCLGSVDETAGNSTFQLKPVFTDGKLIFHLFHAGKRMGHLALKPKEREQLEAIQALNGQPFHSPRWFPNTERTRVNR